MFTKSYYTEAYFHDFKRVSVYIICRFLEYYVFKIFQKTQETNEFARNIKKFMLANSISSLNFQTQDSIEDDHFISYLIQF